MMLNKSKRDYLKKAYFTPGNPGAFGGINRFWNIIKNDKKVTLRELKDWLSEQDTYTGHRRYIRKFKRPRIVVPHLDAVWGADTAHMSKLDQYNDGYSYFVVFIDIFSRYAWAYPLKTLKGNEMVGIMKTLFKEAKCEKLWTDAGTEFSNKLLTLI